MFTLDVASALTPWNDFASESGDAKRAVGGPVSAKSSLQCMGLRSAGYPYRDLVDLQTERDDEHSPPAVGSDGSGAQRILRRKFHPVSLMPSPVDVDQALMHSRACREHATVIIHNKRCLRPMTPGNDDPELMAEVEPSSIDGDDGPSQSPREEPVVIIHAKRYFRPITPELAPADDSALDHLTDFESPWSAPLVIHAKPCMRPVTPELSSADGEMLSPCQVEDPWEKPVVIHAKRCLRPITPELGPAGESTLDDFGRTQSAEPLESPLSAPVVIHATRCMRPVTPELGPTDVLTDELHTLEPLGDAGKVNGNFQCADAGMVHRTVTAMDRATIVKTVAGATEQASFDTLQMTRMTSDEADFTPVGRICLLADEHTAGQCPQDDIERQSVCSRAHLVPALALPTDCFNLISAEEALALLSSMEPSSRHPQWQVLPGNDRTPEKWANIAGIAASTEERVVAVTEMTPEQVTSSGTDWIKAFSF